MGKQHYDLVMSEVKNIVVAVNKFPESAQGSACTAFVSALLYEGTDLQKDNAHGDQPISFATGVRPEFEAELVDRDHVAEIKKDVADYSLGEATDIEFAAYVTRYYTDVGPEHVRVDAITGVQLEEAFAIAGRKPPKRFRDTLHNAKKAKEPLLNSGRSKGSYVLTAIGRYHVENVLLNRNGL